MKTADNTSAKESAGNSAQAVIRVLSNAFSSVEFDGIKLLIDPWAVGVLYKGTWACYPTPRDLAKFIHATTHVFISHIHEDHCDPETLRQISRDVQILIPDIYPNHVLKKKIAELGFSNIAMLPVEKEFHISKSVSLEVVPPLNKFGQETGLVADDENKIAIDAGVLISCKDGNQAINILSLSDNSPYEIDKYMDKFSRKPVDALLFAYNSFAQDYPLCYDNLVESEKQRISLNMCLKGETFLRKFVDEVRPRALIPYSADFALVGTRAKEFFTVHPAEFLHKDNYATRIQKLTGIPAFALYEDDSLRVGHGTCEYSRRSTDQQRRAYVPPASIVRLGEPNESDPLPPEKLLQVVERAAANMFVKSKSIVEKIKPWRFIVKIAETDTIFEVDWSVLAAKIVDDVRHDKVLVVTLTESRLIAILDRKDHWNNAQIGCYLSWARYPNEYNHYLYDAINFFHLPFGESIASVTQDPEVAPLRSEKSSA